MQRSRSFDSRPIPTTSISPDRLSNKYNHHLVFRSNRPWTRLRPKSHSAIIVTRLWLGFLLESYEGQVLTVGSLIFSANFGSEVAGMRLPAPTPAVGLFAPDGIPDDNPEAIIVGTPLDRTKNVPTALGNAYEDIAGVVTYQSLVSTMPHPPTP
ncbi:hypothetical protein BJ322DRAFT_1074566 [Thelephora terrestris]|uniref:Uncharacterized protein n=1 Tax=Thelephora terrestris TaxID=56493 RepID=A0A9P6H986_9AGAM|nr:hypothetical protein BJ322DRAFT_1074566 [Thelephora terrestris]